MTNRKETNEAVIENRGARKSHEDSLPPHGEAVELNVPTCEQVDHYFREAMANVALAFTLEVERRKEEIDQATGEVVQNTTVVDRMRFFKDQLLGTFVWKLEGMIRKLDEDIAAQDQKIYRALAGTTKDEKSDDAVAGMTDWMEMLVEQRSVVGLAHATALDAYETLTGRVYGAKPKKVEMKLPASDPRLQRLNDLRARAGLRR